jgi:hypothetical protein
MKKKSATVQWNHLEYVDQISAMKKINELIESQTDETIKVALTAALMELEIWSNAPLDVSDDELMGDQENLEKIWIN